MNVSMEDEVECDHTAAPEPTPSQATTSQAMPPPAPPAPPITVSVCPNPATQPMAPPATPLFMQSRYGITPTPNVKKHYTVQINHYDFRPFYRWLSTTSAPRKGTSFTFSMRPPQSRSLKLTPSDLEKKLKQGLYYLWLASLYYPYALNTEVKVAWPSTPKKSKSEERGARRRRKLMKRVQSDLNQVIESCIDCTRQTPTHASWLFSDDELVKLYRGWADRSVQLYVGEGCMEGALVVRRHRENLVKKQEPHVSTMRGGLRYGFIHSRLGGRTLCAVAPGGRRALFPPERRDSVVEQPTEIPAFGRAADLGKLLGDEETLRQYLCSIGSELSVSEVLGAMPALPKLSEW